MIRPNQLDPDRACVLVIDLQAKLLPAIVDQQRVIASAAKLLDGAAVFGLPVLATEQYPKGLGKTDALVSGRLTRIAAPILEKPTFSACGGKLARQALLDLDRPQIILTGIETHVCVLQTALDLRMIDYDVFVCADAVGSRSATDHQVALDRMRHDGVIVSTVEAVLFELCGRCDSPKFKAMLEVIKANPPSSDR
jgi:isochorismate hydrolase